ncbi:TetR/AcrR family transcriptional regulator [Bailinhaonella thermotolerans]|uniref:TetR/AcrR family transcriptional regulator n=1 Tax=Bailinhaonella thermotolerans TaxID=1070861 RepID=A0A3A4AXC4_9ACTN|nr:TetR/AcrR family transcriptional regulator [Bailinhaonella thermotolerans]RJL32044.1 TetR/AcrR family transcriptional regulator [Bailinhaonella thermotolerans]
MKNARDGRARILEGALRRFSQDGVSATTLARLRQDSGVSVGSFYHHFASKEHVFGVLYAETLRMYQDEFLKVLAQAETARAGISGIVAFHIAWCGDHPDRARLLFGERPPRRHEPGGPETAELRKGFFGQVIDWWKPHARNGDLKHVDVTTCYVLWLGPAQELCRLWFAGARTPGQAEIETLSEAAWLCLRQTPES